MYEPSPEILPVERPPRKLSRAARRQQLIEATIEVLAQKGYARMTLGDVARQAGLSHGLVNFHFETKEKLLAATLVALAEEYRLNWMDELGQAGEAPAAQLDALLRADFVPGISSTSRLAAWCSFWGEAQARPVYQQECGANDDQYIEVMEGVCARLIAADGLALDATRVARALRAAVEGVWLDLMTMNAPYAREEGLATVYTAAAAFFPRHFTEDGLIA